MITKVIQVKGGEYAVETDGRIRAVETHYGLSTDTKPLGAEGVMNADRFMEMDSGEVFVFDADGNTWHPI